MLNAATAINLYSRQAAKLQTAVTNDAQVKRETDYFLANISSVKSAGELVRNERLLAVATKAFGLSDMAYAKAFLVKLMEGGLDDGRSMANTLVDSRFKAFVQTFNFGDLGAAATQISSRMENVVADYRRQVFEDRAGAANPAAKLALYFQRQAPNISSGMDILADKALYQFAQTALDLPSTPLQTDEALRAAAKFIEKRMDIGALKSPAGLEKLTSRFAAMWDIKNQTTDASSNALGALLGNASVMTYATLLQLQQKYSR